MAFPPPPNNHIIQAMAASLMGSGMPPQPYHQMTPMGGLIPMQMMHSMPPAPMTPMGVTVPSGVTTISAPPVRKIQPEAPQPPPPSLLGVYPGANPVSNIFQQMAAASQDPQHNYRKPRPPPGSTITVFVGNITDRASDMLIRQLLSKCGAVNNWKRVQGANGKLQAFGFCEYCDPESAMRAVRLLLDFEIADKKLVVKVDPKTQEKLDEYKKTKGVTGNELDNQTKEEDSIISAQLQTVLKEHEIELSKDPDPKERIRRFQNDKRDPTKPENLSEMDLEDDKRSLIHREIDKFRDTYKGLTIV
jgi:RNA-binding protein 25